jgi:hypothetical protein
MIMNARAQKTCILPLGMPENIRPYPCSVVKNTEVESVCPVCLWSLLKGRVEKTMKATHPACIALLACVFALLKHSCDAFTASLPIASRISAPSRLHSMHRPESGEHRRPMRGFAVKMSATGGADEMKPKGNFLNALYKFTRPHTIRGTILASCACVTRVTLLCIKWVNIIQRLHAAMFEGGHHHSLTSARWHTYHVFHVRLSADLWTVRISFSAFFLESLHKQSTCTCSLSCFNHRRKCLGRPRVTYKRVASSRWNSPV